MLVKIGICRRSSEAGAKSLKIPQDFPISFKVKLAIESMQKYLDQGSTEGQTSTAVAEGFAHSATATATEGSYGRRPKF